MIMKIFGILNITEDSFFDGGEYLEYNKAILQIQKLIQEGAQGIDVGAQASNINAKIISAETEWNRILPVLKFLRQEKIFISVDTYKPYVIQKCIEYGVDYLNNIKAFCDQESLDILASNLANLPNLILMYSHSQSEKAELNSHLKVDEVIYEIEKFFDERANVLISLGVPEEKLIFDPGLGFFLGENPDLSFTVLKNLSILKKKYKKIFISPSRKSFLGAALGGLPPKDRIYATLAAEIYCYLEEVDFIRTHNPLPIFHSIKILQKIREMKHV